MAKMNTRMVDEMNSVGRGTYVHKFQEHKSEHIREKKENHRILVYYGISGIGKSQLQKKIYHKIIDSTSENDFAVRINFESYSLASSFSAILYELVQRVKKSGISFPKFEYAYLIYYAKANPLVKIKHDDTISKLHLETITPVVQAFIVSNLISVPVGIAGSVVQKASAPVQKWWREFQYPELLQLGTLDVHEIEQWLPRLFADDLNYYLNENPTKCPIFFFDSLENLAGKQRDEDYILNHDKWLRRMVYELPKVLWVFSGREKLQWASLHKDEQWDDNLYQYEVKEFLEEDFIELMDFYHIDDESIREKIESSSERHPFYVALSVKTFQQIAQIRTPTVSDFGNNFPEIYRSFIRHLAKEELDTFKVLST